jgi:hypothetical protein
MVKATDAVLRKTVSQLRRLLDRVTAVETGKIRLNPGLPRGWATEVLRAIVEETEKGIREAAAPCIGGPYIGEPVLVAHGRLIVAAVTKDAEGNYFIHHFGADGSVLNLCERCVPEGRCLELAEFCPAHPEAGS